MADRIAMAPGGQTSWEKYMEQNQIVRDWSKKVKGELKQSLARFTKGKRGPVIRGGAAKKNRYARYFAMQSGKERSMVIQKKKDTGQRLEKKVKTSLNHRVFYKFSISEGVSFRFERHGVFLHKGVGRGYQMQGGMVVRVAKNPPKGPARQPVDWFNHIINARTPQLANDIARVNADAALNAARMRIN
jgi:hypothetical protein